MKAWLAREKDSEYATVVFADTRGKARSEAQATDACEDAAFCDIEIRRMPQMDKYYRAGKREMDWYDRKDRIALVKDCGFFCENLSMEDCVDCPAREFCKKYKDCMECEEEVTS